MIVLFTALLCFVFSSAIGITRSLSEVESENILGTKGSSVLCTQSLTAGTPNEIF